MRGSGVASASSMEEMVASGSYSTLTSSAASYAASSVTAATATTGSPTKRTRSGQRACSSCETGRMPKGIGRSLPVRYPRKPDTFSASETSIDWIKACGTRERTSLTWHMRGNARSSANLVAPVTLARPSTRRNGLSMMLSWLWGSASGSFLRTGSAMEAPHSLTPLSQRERGENGLRRRRSGGPTCPPFSLLSLGERRAGVVRVRAVEDLVRRRPVLAAHAGRGPLHAFDDLVVAGAAAEVAGEGLADLVAARLGVLRHQRLGRHQNAGRAVAALGRSEVGEGGLQGVELVAALQPLDGFDLPALHLGGE